MTETFSMKVTNRQDPGIEYVCPAGPEHNDTSLARSRKNANPPALRQALKSSLSAYRGIDIMGERQVTAGLGNDGDRDGIL